MTIDSINYLLAELVGLNARREKLVQRVGAFTAAASVANGAAKTRAERRRDEATARLGKVDDEIAQVSQMIDSLSDPVLDTAPPNVTLIAASRTHNTYTVSCATDEVATVVLEVSLVSGGTFAAAGTSVERQTHAITVTGAAASTTYFYRLRATDQQGNETLTSERSVTTTAAPTDGGGGGGGGVDVDPDGGLFKAFANHFPHGSVRLSTVAEREAYNPQTDTGFQTRMHEGPNFGRIGVHAKCVAQWTPIGTRARNSRLDGAPATEFSMWTDQAGTFTTVDQLLASAADPYRTTCRGSIFNGRFAGAQGKTITFRAPNGENVSTVVRHGLGLQMGLVGGANGQTKARPNIRVEQGAYNLGYRNILDTKATGSRASNRPAGEANDLSDEFWSGCRIAAYDLALLVARGFDRSGSASTAKFPYQGLVVSFGWESMAPWYNWGTVYGYHPDVQTAFGLASPSINGGLTDASAANLRIDGSANWYGQMIHRREHIMFTYWFKRYLMEQQGSINGALYRASGGANVDAAARLPAAADSFSKVAWAGGSIARMWFYARHTAIGHGRGNTVDGRVYTDPLHATYGSYPGDNWSDMWETDIYLKGDDYDAAQLNQITWSTASKGAVVIRAWEDFAWQATGVLCRASTATAGTTVTLSQATRYQRRLLKQHEGQSVWIGTAANPQSVGIRTLTAFNESTGVATFSSAVTMNKDDHIIFTANPRRKMVTIPEIGQGNDDATASSTNVDNPAWQRDMQAAFQPYDEFMHSILWFHKLDAPYTYFPIGQWTGKPNALLELRKWMGVKQTNPIVTIYR